MIDRLYKNHCTGCSACVNICPQNSIMMKAEHDGFLYPVIDRKTCIQCNLCEKVCPSLVQFLDEDKKEPKVKAAWSLDRGVRWHSTSGGIFTELAKSFLTQGNYVVGARYTEKFLVEHYIIQKIDEISILRQSKYVQSDKKEVFKQIKALLEVGKKVLFVGSPCEVAGLYGFLQKKYTGLVTVDFVCLGANSPKVYLKFLEMLEEKYNSKIKKIWFKNKTYGWNRFSTKVEFVNGDYYLKDRNDDYFMRGYIGQNKFYTRPSCSECQYKKIPRVADLTLADFWGIANKDKNLDDDMGTSLVMINSSEGEKLFAEIQSEIYSYDCELSDALHGNMAIFNSVKLDSRRNDFYNDLDVLRFDKLINIYCKVSIKKRSVDIIKKILVYFHKVFC